MKDAVEKRPPCLYMLWPVVKRDVVVASPQADYRVRVYRDGDDSQLIELNRSDGESMSVGQWRDYLDQVLPEGLFVGEQVATGEIVATAGAVHNAKAGRYYFPFGGELGYLIVAREHRRRGLGGAVSGAVVGRLLAAGYRNIWVCVQEHRVAAIRTYLAVGFEPFLYAAEVAQRWRDVCGELGVAYRPDVWPQRLPTGEGRQPN